MSATQPQIHGDLRSEMTDAAIEHLIQYFKNRYDPRGILPNIVHIKPARIFAVNNLNHTYQGEFRGEKPSASDAKVPVRVPYRNSLRQIVEEAAISLGYIRAEHRDLPNGYRWELVRS